MILDDKLGTGGDDAYAALIAAHEGLTAEQSHALNARLILILMNEVGDPARFAALVEAARQTLD